MQSFDMTGIVAIAMVFAIAVFVIAVYLVPCWRICGRMGFSPWLSLLMLISPVNIILLYYLAFAEWPAMRRPDSISGGSRVQR